MLFGFERPMEKITTKSNKNIYLKYLLIFTDNINLINTNELKKNYISKHIFISLVDAEKNS